MKSILMAAAFTLGCGTGAMAEGWSTTDLGDTASEADCMARAERVANRAKSRWGAHSVKASTWSVSLYDIGDDDSFDALFLCTEGPNNGNRATLVIYSLGVDDGAQRRFYADGIKEIWKRQ